MAPSTAPSEGAPGGLIDMGKSKAIGQQNEEPLDHSSIRQYYDGVYYKKGLARGGVPNHYRRLATRCGPWEGKRLLDIGCGTGLWLKAAADLGAVVAGVDISGIALEVCREVLPEAQLHCGPAEKLPFDNGEFDFVSCLGALEHFLDAQRALREMIRVAKPDADLLLLVPNADFPPRRLGLYSGTEQAAVREEVRSLEGWQTLFESAGLRVVKRWRDLHVLSPAWIFRGPRRAWPIRAAQALALPVWPLKWQYQVYHLCSLK